MRLSKIVEIFRSVTGGRRHFMISFGHDQVLPTRFMIRVAEPSPVPREDVQA